MKIRNPYYAFIFLVIIGLSSSCKKENNSSEPNDITVVNGVLKFKNQEVLEATTRFIMNSTQEQLDVWEKQFPSFVSSRTVFNRQNVEFDALKTETEFNLFIEKYSESLYLSSDSTLTNKINSPLLSAISNSDGEFYVGDEIRLIKEHSHNAKTPQIKTHPNDGFSGKVYEDGFYNDARNRRLFVSYYANPYTYEYYFEILQQRKGTFGWSNNSTDIYVSNRTYTDIYGTFSSGSDIAALNTNGIFVQIRPSGASGAVTGSSYVASGGVPQTHFTTHTHYF